LGDVFEVVVVVEVFVGGVEVGFEVFVG